MKRKQPDHPRSSAHRPLPPAPKANPAAALDAAGDYQDRIGELERTVTTLTGRLEGLTAELEDARQVRSYFLELFENAPAGYLVHDFHGGIADCNRAAAELLGLKRRQDRNVGVAQFILRADLPHWLKHLRRCVLTRRPCAVELSLQARGRAAVPVQLLTRPVPAPHGQDPVCFYTVLLDLSGRRATETALAQSQQDYRQLIDTIEGIVWEADAHTLDVTFVSQYAERLLGYPLSEWQRPGFWLSHVYAADRDRVANELARAVEQRADVRLEYRVLTAERQLFWLHDSLTLSKQGRRLKLMGVAVDVTPQRMVQEQLREAQNILEQRVEERTAELRRSVAELEMFSYSVSHDLRAPLRAMNGFAELAINVGGAQLPARSREFIERIMAGAGRADRLVQDLLSYSRVARANFKLEPVDLEKLVREVLGQSPQFQAPHARVELPGPLLPVLGHEISLAQALTNLVSNAIKFVAPGTVPHVRLWTEPMGGQVRLWVQDNGIGIEAHNLGRIFGIFERLHLQEQFEGTGIGLAIVRKAAERMGGSVGVQSEPGKGSRFWLQLAAVVGKESGNS